MAAFSAKLFINSFCPNQLVLPNYIYLVSKSDFLAIRVFLMQSHGQFDIAFGGMHLHHGSADFSPNY